MSSKTKQDADVEHPVTRLERLQDEVLEKLEELDVQILELLANAARVRSESVGAG